MMKIKSNHAILDVRDGKAALNRRFFNKPDAEPVKVIITGYINDIWGCYDGISQEFALTVESVEVQEDKPNDDSSRYGNGPPGKGPCASDMFG